MPDTPFSFSEPPFQFVFGRTVWADVVQYDKSSVHQNISKHIQSLQAVDFVALGRQSCKRVALIEVKDYAVAGRVPVIKELAIEVAQKVAGTLTGLSSSSRAPTDEFQWKESGRALLSDEVPLVVYLYAEYPAGESTPDIRGALESLRAELAVKLSWLPRCEIIVCNQRVPRIADCQVQRV